ncbi:TPA: hypothetical protein OBO24_004609 [Escherichia coli]|nr:hypothetical protein [Escherichia coli]EHS9967587.1 hypothetical protein [Escherichia coli]EID8807152.1 hypothetical protein [Escherichia coli]EIL3204904.1 hypothetical protein [Escherichia coli]EIP0551709.1 hypothetical protein [Escherichia coli]
MGVDERITIDGTTWEVEPDMAGETVILLWGLFDEGGDAQWNENSC